MGRMLPNWVEQRDYNAQRRTNSQQVLFVNVIILNKKVGYANSGTTLENWLTNNTNVVVTMAKNCVLILWRTMDISCWVLVYKSSKTQSFERVLCVLFLDINHQLLCHQ